MMKINKILNILSASYPDARCMLDYEKDYELVIAVMLSSQTTDASVNKVTPILFSRFDNLDKLKNASYQEVFEIVKKLGLAKKKAANIINIARIISEDFNYKVPNDIAKLEKLPGVGRKTINVILSELFNEDTLAVDTHVSRLACRLGFANEDDSVLKIEEKLLEIVPKGKRKMTHHLFIRHGREVCKSYNPQCNVCEIKDYCLFKK